MKIRSPQTTGDEPLHDGSSCFHLMFSVGLHVPGRFLASVVVPSPLGPRQPGQWAAAAATDATHATNHAAPSARPGKRNLSLRAIGEIFMGTDSLCLPTSSVIRGRDASNRSAMRAVVEK